MKRVYPVVFTKVEDGYAAYVPDMEIDTQGDDLAEAIEMARDAIGIMGIDMRTVRRNVSLPSWLNAAADKAGLNVSSVLQTALKQELANRP